jgi:NitT/TauT family transport system permease protein
MKKSQNILEICIFLLVFFGVLELLSKSLLIPNYILPAPSLIIHSWVENLDDYLTALWSTTVSSFLGLMLSTFVGLLLALIFSLSIRTQRLILPFCVFFQTVPIIAIAPLMVIWFGFGRPTVVASSLVVSFFPILANALLGLDSTSPGHRDLFQLMGASRWQVLKMLQIPSALTQIFGGFRIAAGLAVIGALVGEFVGGGGLGALIDSARTQQKIEMVFGAVILSSLLGLGYMALLRVLSFAFKKYLQPS